MKKMFVMIAALIFMSCAAKKTAVEGPELGYSFLPGYLNFDSIAFPPKPMDEVVDSTLPDFPTIPIDSGLLIVGSDSTNVPDGLLISEKTGAKYVFYKYGFETQEKELKVAKQLMKVYYEGAQEAEKAYQKEIKKLEKEAERNWFEKNIIYFGFAAGLVVAIMTEMAVIEAAK